MQVNAPISVGELFDKITILRIKRERFLNLSALTNVQYELDCLTEISKEIIFNFPEIKLQVEELHSVNLKLWEIESAKRHYGKLNKFDDEFLQIAKDVYVFNDRRAEIKKNINMICKSKIVEEKMYS